MAMEALRIAAKESKIMKFVLGGFIFLAVGGLVFTDVGGYFSGGANGTTVARVGDTKIHIREFDAELRGFLQQTGLTAEQAYDAGLVNAFLNQKISNVLKLEAAQELNIRLDNRAVAAKVRDIFGDVSKDQIESTLRAQGINEQQMANMIRLQAVSDIANQMPAVVANYVPSYVVEAQKSLNAERRDGDIHTISFDSLVDSIEITDADIMDYYQSNTAQFIVSEARTFTIGRMTSTMAKKNVPMVTNDQVQAYYQDNKDDFFIPEKRSIAQAVVKDADLAQAIYEAALGGATLTAALKDAVGDTDGFRDTVDYDAKGLPAELSDVAFGVNVKKGDVLPPVKTLIGYSIMKVTNITDGKYKSFNSVKSTLKNEMQNNANYDALYNKMVDAEDMLDNGDGFSSLVEKLELKTATGDSLTRNNLGNAGPLLKKIIEASPSIGDELFSLPENGATYPLELDDNEFVIVGVKSITQQDAVALDDVKKDIISALKTTRKTAMAEAKASELTNTLNQGVALPKSLTVKTSTVKKLKRDGDNKNTSLIYSLDKDAYGYRLDNNAVTIVKLTDVTFSNKIDDVDVKTIRTSQNALVNTLSQSYWRDDMNVTINDALLKQAYSENTQ
jgi:peptidyl-prolyl cis-trans isomerase D